MPEFYFLGTLVQYWQTVYAEYLRLTALLGQEPFSITASELKFPLSEYEPKINGLVQIDFFAEANKTLVVSVCADSVIGAELVNVYVEVGPNYEREGKSAHARWQEMFDAWEQKGWLINSAAKIVEMAQQAVKHQQPIKPSHDCNLSVWFDWYHQMLDTGHHCTLEIIAIETGYSKGRIRQLHANYVNAMRKDKSFQKA